MSRWLPPIWVPSGSTSHKLVYDALDTSGDPVQDLTSPTVHYSLEGATAAAWTTPTVDIVKNDEGMYALTLDEQTTMTATRKTQQLTLIISDALIDTVKCNVILYDESEWGVNVVTIEGSDATNQINAECDTAISDAALATAANLATVDSNVDAILVDTGTTLPATLATIDSNVDAILVDTGTTIPGTITTIDTNVDAILVDTGTTLPATLTSIEGKVDTVDTVVDGIQTDLDNATDGLGALKALIDAVDTVVDAVLVDTGTTLPATLTTIDGKVDTVDTNVDAILVDTGTTLPGTLTTIEGKVDTVDTVVDSITTTIGVAGAGLTDLGGMSTGMKGEVNAECDTALTDYDAVVPGDLPTNFSDLSITVTTGYVDVGGIAGSSTAATNLSAAADTMVNGTVDTGTTAATTTTFEADDITEATADHFINRRVYWKTGNLTDSSYRITDYALAGSNGSFTVTTMTEAPANNDTFVIV